MKLKSYLFLGLATLALASCDDDFGDWVTPANNQQGAIASFGNGSVTPVGTIDFRTLTDADQTVKVCDIVAPTSSDTAYVNSYQIKFGDDAFTLNSDGTMARSDLETYVNNKWGKRPVERTTKAAIVGFLGNGATATRFTSDSIDIKTIAQAPEIEQTYYFTGTMNGWSNSDTSYPLTNGGGDVYDDPVFTAILDAADGNIEFKLTPASMIGTNDWSKCITAAADNAEGKLADNNAGGNLVIPHIDGAKKIRVTFNLLDQTWSYEALNFNEFIYYIGGGDWATSRPLYGVNYDGSYLGYYYVGGNFKFKPNADDWNDDWGQDPNGDTGKLVQEGEVDCTNPGDGYYRIEVNIADLTYKLTKVESISMIGTVQGNWDTDLDMTYNTTTGNWEWTGDLNAGKVKFRVNHGWDISWGGKDSSTDYDNLTESNGKDLDVTEAGTYKVTLTVHQEKGDCKVVFEKQ